jgi:hypothetical protein
MARRWKSGARNLAGMMGALVLVTASPGVAQLQIPNCEIRVEQDGRFDNSSTSKANLTATATDGSLRLGRKVVMADDTSVSGALVRLGNSASVFDLNATDVHRGRNSEVRGTETHPFTPTPFACDVAPITCGDQDFSVAKNKSATLGPGNYNLIDLANGATLKLAPGLYNVCAIRTGKHAAIQVGGPGQTTINVAGEVRLQNDTTLGPIGNAAIPLLNVLGNSVRFSADSDVRAFVQAPEARLALGRSSTFTGAACANTLAGSRNVDVLCATSTTTTTTTSTSTTTISTTTTTGPTTTTTTTLPLIQCCLPGSPMGAFTCVLETASACSSASGANLGPGTCDPNPCGGTTTTTAPTTTTTAPTTTTTAPTTTTTAPTTTTTAPTTTTTAPTTTTTAPTTTTTTTSTTTTTMASPSSAFLEDAANLLD